jgi:hypothetical protein
MEMSGESEILRGGQAHPLQIEALIEATEFHYH